jgi:tetratricopeptide (TPR) repeat protein
MGFFLEELEKRFHSGPLAEDKLDDSLELVFDDEPLERILYGEELPGPTVANLFLPGFKYVEQISQACKGGDIQEALKKLCEYQREKYPLSLRMCYRLTASIKDFVPNFPNPRLEHDLTPLGPMLEEMWQLALKGDDKRLQQELGTVLYRWYEHYKHYEDARGVLTVLIDITRERGDRANEAVMLNNYAFEYLLEEKWQEAIPLFEQAAKMFEDKGDEYEYANARANYWTCRFECDDLDNLEEIEEELKKLRDVLSARTGWHARKPLVLLAKLEEQRGNTEDAIELVEQAIEASRGSNTRYPEIDANYLRDLKRSGRTNET